ncbi:Alanyl-tRNA synthetase mitochondrial [Carabus blaptoides fortunei]
MPYCDPTVAFVNAGMNQFKSVFLGQQSPMYTRVSNSQKCVRVGGKHNDISIVGSDGYHHTFFEMLGNWSFDDYFKKEACEMAWNLLIGPYGINPSSLYVTYFAGDTKMNLESDLECRDIWKSIGIADDHIVPFGSKENFWEMGATGPCGPCTEIHIDHLGQKNRSLDVNRGLPDLTELWNIVFIQYNRNINGTISLLPKRHIDTGMGLERLTAILQNKSSNYDTDIFSNLFNYITKKCKGLPVYAGKFGANDLKGIDTSYRILADHSRMITACLADGMIPEENQKLRRILRKAMLISETVFKQKKGLITELTKVVSDNLGAVYPEMEKNLSQIQEIIMYEEEVYKSIRLTASKDWYKLLEKEPKLKDLNVLEMPGLVTAYNELISLNTQTISSQLAFKLYDSYGLDEFTIQSLSEALNLKFESEYLKKELDLARKRTKLGFLSRNTFENITQNLIKQNISKTDDSFKYNYCLKNDAYEFDDVDIKVLKIIKNGKEINSIESNTECYLVLDRTNLYSEAGGQNSDKGFIKFGNEKLFKINDTLNINGYIFHKGEFASDGKLQIGENGLLSLDKEYRLKNMANHTATHLLNAALKKVVNNGVTCQKSSTVTPDYLSFDVGVYSKKLSIEDIEKVEHLIGDAIRNSVCVNVSEINSQQLLNLSDVTLIPGEVYPEVGIRLIEIETRDLFSREPCCGTHVRNTSDIQDICITNVRSLGRSTTSLTAVTRDRAILARTNGEKIINKVMNIKEKLNLSTIELNILDKSISQLKQKLNHNLDDEFILPVYVKSECLKILDDLAKRLRDSERDSLKQFIDLEMKSVIETNECRTKNNKPYIVHFLGCSSILDNVPLQRATKVCANVPVIVISYSDDMAKARCCVPQNMVTDKFNAELWLNNTVVNVFKSSSSAPKGQDATLVCNMKAKRIKKIHWDSLIEEALVSAKKFADTYL